MKEDGKGVRTTLFLILAGIFMEALRVWVALMKVRWKRILLGHIHNNIWRPGIMEWLHF